jgi:hypothetical protein
MSQLRICPDCRYKNTLYQTECLQCGAWLGDDTLPTSPFSSARVAESFRQAYLAGHSLPPFALALFVTGEESPILLPNQGQVVLGRSASTVSELCLDLSSYGARSLGVSRRHAIIRFSGDACILEDLDSSNGTWLNGSQLVAYRPYPLQNGDVIRLGQLLLYVSLNEELEAA